MSEQLEAPDLSPGNAAWLRAMARAFEEIAPPDEPFRATDFIEWLLLERRARGHLHREEQHETRSNGQLRRHQTRAVAAAG